MLSRSTSEAAVTNSSIILANGLLIVIISIFSFGYNFAKWILLFTIMQVFPEPDTPDSFATPLYCVLTRAS